MAPRRETRTLPASSQAAALPACLLALLVPGLGHFYLKRNIKGLVFLGAIGALFLIGLTMDARLVMVFDFTSSSAFIGSLFVDPLATLRHLAQMSMGLPYFLARSLGIGIEADLVKSITNEYGNTFTEVGGLLNVLVVLDAYDTALGRKSR
jgi:TM2 domain-containing membrane protein YozV